MIKNIISELLSLIEEYNDPIGINVSASDLYPHGCPRICDCEIDCDCGFTLTENYYLVIEIRKGANQSNIEKNFREVYPPQIICTDNSGTRLLFYPEVYLEG